ncbi:MAG: hypothetical protein ACREMR_09285 [Gemmatimonadales bacterium]
MVRRASDERGIALGMAMFSLVVISALVAGTVFTGTQEQRVAENTRYLQQSFGIAEGGAYEVVRGWDSRVYNRSDVYPAESATVAETGTSGGTGAFGGHVYRLNDNLYLVDVTGMDSLSGAGRLPGRGARQRIGVLVRVRPIDIGIGAALTAMGDIDLKGTTEVDGADHVPNATWTECAPPDTAKAGIHAHPSADIDLVGGAVIAGAPPVWKDPQLRAESFMQYGDVSYGEVAQRANITLPPGTYRTEPVIVGAVCDTTVATNWGDGISRYSACGNYFPVVHITGSATLNGVQGQGVLLVDGDLEVQGGYEFYGIAIIRGKLKTAGGGAALAHFWGGVLAANVDLDLVSLSGHATLNYSKCAITNALQAASATAPLRSRSWIQLF